MLPDTLSACGLVSDIQLPFGKFLLFLFHIKNIHSKLFVSEFIPTEMLLKTSALYSKTSSPICLVNVHSANRSYIIKAAPISDPHIRYVYWRRNFSSNDPMSHTYRRCDVNFNRNMPELNERQYVCEFRTIFQYDFMYLICLTWICNETG